jgi:hypothetical protein
MTNTRGVAYPPCSRRHTRDGEVYDQAQEPVPHKPTPDLEAVLELAAEPTKPKAVVGGVRRDGTVIRIGEGQHLEEIATIFIHHPAELDGCLPGNPLRKLAPYIVAIDTMVERIDNHTGGPRRQRARLLCFGGHDHPLIGWARFVGEPDEWCLQDDLCEIEEYVGAMISELT